MKILFEMVTHTSMGLGVEIWSPKHKTWKRLELTLIIGHYYPTITIGSKRQYLEEMKLTSEHSEDLWR